LESINEKFGKGAGNQIITQIASFIREQEQDRFYCARWKGGSFIFVFPNYDEEAVVSWMMRLKAHLEHNPLPIRDNQSFRASFSASVADISGIIPFGEAISLTEDLLFLAKSVGRNRILTPKDKLTPLLKRVLLADDDELIASIVKHRLTREGFEVHHAPDGEEALRMAKTGTYSLVILDVKMPVFDGFELVKLLREMPTYSKTPIMMLTSLGEDKDIVRGLNLGANDYMLKPFSPLELIARVRRMLKS
jgi:diguanylate cyclase (GGDEF)-like protein